MKHLTGVWFAVALAGLSFITGCGKQTAGIQIEGEKSLEHQLSDEEMRLSYFAKQVEGYENNVFTKAFRMTNVLLEPTLSPNVTDMDQTLSLAVASKNIPDVIYDWTRENFIKYGMQGALIPLGDLIDEYAPNFKAYLNENPEVRYFITAGDGNIYFVPFVINGKAERGWFIRRDWLSKVEMKIPRTVDELYEVMKAFRDGDPNSNGLSDEIAFFGTKGNISPLLALFDAYGKFSYKDGKVAYGPMEDNFKKAMKEIKKWYSEGLIDPEIYTRTDIRAYFCGNNLGGITHDWIGSTMKTNATYAPKIEGYDLAIIAPPAGDDGVCREVTRRKRINGEGWAISSLNKHPELTMKYFDFWWSEEGVRLASYGIEGEQYDMVNGAPVVRDSILKGEVPADRVMIGMRSNTNFGFPQDFGFEEQWAGAEAISAMKMYENNGYIPKEEEIPSLAYSTEQEKRYKELKTQIETYCSETVQKWILVSGDIEEEFEAFRSQLCSLGIEEYIAIEQEAYDKYLEAFNR